MKKIIYIFIAILLSNCAVYKPDSSSISTPDYNKRVNVSSAHYDKVLTTAGVSSFVVGTATGAYLGYTMTEGSDYFANYQGAEKSNYSVAGGVLGGFLGFSATYFLNRALGWGSYKPATDPNKWIKKANKNFLLAKKENNTDFTLIHTSAESNFTVKNINDARDFSRAFTPKSSFANSVCKQTINNSGIYRDDYQTLINLYPKNKYLLDMKKSYVSKSSSVSSLYSAYDKYPETNLEIEFKSSDLVTDYSSVKLFHSRFSKSLYNRKVIIKSMDNSSVSEIKSMKSMFNKTFYLSQYDFQKYSSYVSSIGKKKYSNALYEIKSPYTIYDLEAFYHQYNWLKYNEKSNEIISNYWNIANKRFSNGNKVLAIVNSLSKDRAYNNWNITNKMVNNFIAKKLKSEINKNISYKLYNIKTPNTPQWKQWVNNNNLTAGLVDMTKLSYLISGKVINNSKFDLPLKLSVTAKLYKTTKVQGAVGDALETVEVIASFFGKNIELNESTSYMGTMSEEYYIPQLKRNKNHTFAIVFDVGSKSGINALDWIKLTEEIEVKGTNVSNIEYYSYNLSNSVIKQQKTWQNFAKKGLPEVKLTDIWRNKEYSNSEWERKHEIELEQKRQAAERASQAENNRKHEASTLKQSNFSWKWDGNWSGGGSLLWNNFPYEHEFIIMKDGKEWAKGNIEKAQKSNSFNVEFEITDYNSSLNGHEIRHYFVYDKDDEQLMDEDTFPDTRIKSNVVSFYSAVALSLDFTIDELLNRIIEYGY